MIFKSLTKLQLSKYTTNSLSTDSHAKPTCFAENEQLACEEVLLHNNTINTDINHITNEYHTKITLHAQRSQLFI